MGRSLDEAFVTSSYCDYSDYTGEPATARITHHRTSSQPSRMVTTYRAVVDNRQGMEPCGGSMDFDGQPDGGTQYIQFCLVQLITVLLCC